MQGLIENERWKSITSKLYEIEERIQGTWSKGFLKLSQEAEVYNNDLFKLEVMLSYREQEDSRNRISYQTLQKKAEIKLQEIKKEEKEENIFYSPSIFLDEETKNEYHFQDHHAIKWLEKMIDPTFHIFPTYDTNSMCDHALDISTIRICALTLKAAFYALAHSNKNESLPIKTFSRLYSLLHDLGKTVEELKKNFQEKERQRIQNKQNAPKISNKIEEYKENSLYPELEEKIKNYRGIPKEKREIYQLIKKIIKSENKGQVRNYFGLFCKEIEK